MSSSILLLSSFAIPCFAWTLPCFVLIGLYAALPTEYTFTRQIFIALYDIWIGVSSATAISVFPFIDHRYRKAAARVPVVRLLLPPGYRKVAPVKIKSEREIEKDKVDTTDVYFNLLSIDLATLKRSVPAV
ncbi:hypothetical protein PRIPAC_79491 [Pristionchus pacificus]|uniref:Uncharacterized protein n=1 Tax=Pristionchus pacificus TaxID=54126 RepID=A0A2A6CMI5_PRIPA|nr:hypothetical protein PRIPAC_79491 [Pristionchus pacificus]|eukprot:PDM79316.1 hypothetical protein PRIPAC_31895 [Pristionchus pacificus]